ncbi:DUF3095 domain-containing protein [Sulfitobacter mediterraneus]|uniref:Adenylate cyclase n=1 Tax=Sulfitobacter mediterraneus TaxID=83219 RepID=A0A061SQJ9_9RHOB|nr:DUF3095 domain-containing protein [Sulfitobacter mediterraneus]KAJ01938.1 adenylate cyclase [Sulfitobacter mediterraneus]
MTDALPPFYASVPVQDDFAALSDTENYTSLPEDWWVGTSDIVGSTQAAAAGKYKTVNMVGAAVISAQINAHGGAAFPYIFGGDGAGFAVPPEWKDRAAQALSAVQVWAAEEFEMSLRIGMVRISEVRAAGHDVRIARFGAAAGVDYAMFAGGGLAWAEARMKDGANGLPPAPAGTQPDLTGLSCRWSHMPSRYGAILSVVIMPARTAEDPAFAKLANQVVTLASGLDRSGHPGDTSGPGVDWPPAGAQLEAHAQHGQGSLGAARRKALFESFVAWLLIKTGLKIGGFDARRYRRVVGQNADFRKFEDGLKMTVDCDPETEANLRALLDEAAAKGVVRYGIHAQSEAMMTCIVPSIMTDDHVHFVDGASGGYTVAAQAIKG